MDPADSLHVPTFHTYFYMLTPQPTPRCVGDSVSKSNARCKDLQCGVRLPRQHLLSRTKPFLRALETARWRPWMSRDWSLKLKPSRAARRPLRRVMSSLCPFYMFRIAPRQRMVSANCFLPGPPRHFLCLSHGMMPCSGGQEWLHHRDANGSCRAGNAEVCGILTLYFPSFNVAVSVCSSCHDGCPRCPRTSRRDGCLIVFAPCFLA